MRKLIAIAVFLCFMMDTLIGMELEEVTESYQLEVVDSIDTARRIANHLPQEQWKNYTLPSEIIVLAIKSTELGDQRIASSEEIALIEQLKNSGELIDAQLTQKAFKMLQQDSVQPNELQKIRQQIFFNDQARAQEKREHAFDRNKYIAEAESKMLEKNGLTNCLSKVMWIEVVTAAVLGLGVLSCWSK